MKIRGNTVGTTMPRTNWNQTDPDKADYLKGKEDLQKLVDDAQKTANYAQTAADNAQTAADNAKTAADNAQNAADDAQNTADDAKTAADNAQTSAYSAQAEAKKAQTTANGKVARIEATAILKAGSWDNKKQTVDVAGVKEDNTIIVSPAYDSYVMCADAQVLCTAQADGKLIFSCENVPGADITVNVVILDEYGAGGVGVVGVDGGYYIPVVTQPGDNTIQFAFTPSEGDMPAVKPVQVELPAGTGPVEKVDLTGYATEEFVKNQIAQAELGGEEVDLSGYAQQSELPTKVSQLENDAGYLTRHQDISGKLDADKLPEAINDALEQAKASGEFDGAQGEKGEKGETGAQGIQGVQGEPGKDGAAGKDGVSVTHSWNGTTLNVTSASGTSSADLKGEKGDRGAQGIQGEPGKNGADGVSPTVSVLAFDSDNLHRVYITDVNGTQTFDVTNGKDGVDGQSGADGVSPTVRIAEIVGGHRVYIDDVNGTKEFDVTDGTDGTNGVDGADGVSVTHEWDGTTLHLWSASGYTATNLKGEKGDQGEQGIQGEQGEKGDKGDTGAAGQNGADGVSPTVAVTKISGGNQVSITDADGTKTFNVMHGEAGVGGLSEVLENTSDYKTKEIVVPSVDVTFTDSMFAKLENLGATTLVKDAYYIVVWNDTRYEEQCFEDDEVLYLGNGSIMGMNKGSDAPFLIMSVGNNTATVYKADSTTETVRIRVDTAEPVEITKKIPKEYLPDDIGGGGSGVTVTNPATPGQMLLVKSVDENGKPTEWETVDRTHYDATVEILPETTITAAVDGDDAGEMVLETSITLEADKTYKIVYNGTEYVCTAVDGATLGVEGGFVVLGNYPLLMETGDSGEPFVILYNPAGAIVVFDTTGATSCTLAIYSEGSVKKLDNKFLDLNWIPAKTVVEEVLLAETTISKAAIVTEIPAEKLAVCETVTVTIDGTEYKREVKKETQDGLVMYSTGNYFLINPNQADTGEPFFLYAIPAMYECVYLVLNPANVTVSISAEVSTYNELPAEHRPVPHIMPTDWMDYEVRNGNNGTLATDLRTAHNALLDQRPVRAYIDGELCYVVAAEADADDYGTGLAFSKNTVYCINTLGSASPDGSTLVRDMLAETNTLTSPNGTKYKLAIDDDGTIPESFIPSNVPMAETAAVGQIMRVKAVDENGKPTEWEAVDLPEGGSGGTDGEDGKDGVSPTVTVTAISGGNRVEITDVNGTQSFDVMNGQDGKDGEDGADGTGSAAAIPVFDLVALGYPDLPLVGTTQIDMDVTEIAEALQNGPVKILFNHIWNDLVISTSAVVTGNTFGGRTECVLFVSESYHIYALNLRFFPNQNSNQFGSEGKQLTAG